MTSILCKVMVTGILFSITGFRLACAGENDLVISESPDSWAIRQSDNNVYYDWCFVGFSVVVPAEHTRSASLYIWNPATSAWVLYHTYNNITDGTHYAAWYNDPDDGHSGPIEVNFSTLYDTYYVKVEFFDNDTGFLDVDYITIDDPPQ